MSVGNLEKLSNLLDQAEKKIKSDNERSMYDTNRHWEKIAMYILNITYDWSLQDLNLIRKNFPGNDLGDYERHIGVQVTKDSSENKINSTFKKIKENKIGGHPISEDYYKIYFFITGKKEECLGLARQSWLRNGAGNKRMPILYIIKKVSWKRY